MLKTNIVSKVAPIGRDELKGERELSNAQVFSALHPTTKVNFVSHDYRETTKRPGKIFEDEIHPTPTGSGLMAGHIGRCL